MVREQSVGSFYKRLREAVSASSSFPLHIYPSTSDVDSLCALRIITRYVLESDCIKCSIFPISSFSDICNHPRLSNHSSSDPPITILLINWGCQQDLLKMLNPGLNAQIFVVDSHRPVHLHNLSEYNDRVIVLYTRDDELQADVAYDFDVSALGNVCDLDEESDDDSEGDDDENSESESEVESGTRKRKRVSQESGGDPVREIKKRMKEYETPGTYHGKPSGCLMFELCFSLMLNTNECLWFACLSLTDQFVHERLTPERYQAGVMELEQRVNECSVNLDAILRDGTKVQAPESYKIVCEDVPKLLLLREWTLFDSMSCSSYIAAKLKTWNDNGMKRLNLLLARMGFPLIECKQKFPYMSLKVRSKLKEELEKFLPEYGITDLFHRSFVRLHAYNSRVCAPDMVYALTALLESYVKADGTSVLGQFGIAYDALSLNNLDKLGMGMEMGIEIQKTKFRLGRMCITRSGLIKSGGKFRWLKLEDSKDVKLLGYPQALTSFGYFIWDALKERGVKMKPLICVCPSQEPGKVIVVGLCGRPRLGSVTGNAFGIAFKKAAKKNGLVQELFEASWMLLDKYALKSFLETVIDKFNYV